MRIVPIDMRVFAGDKILRATNRIITIDMITKEALRIAHEGMGFIDTIDRHYDILTHYETIRVKPPSKHALSNG